MKDHTTAETTATPKRRRWPLVIAAVFAVVLLIAAVGGGNDDATTAAPEPAASVEAPVEEYTPPTATMDPLTNNGTYLVGSEIEPGTYRVEPATGTFSSGIGYWARCADVSCSLQGTGGVTGGILDNATVDGPSFLVIEPTDTAVQLQDVVLTPAE